MKMSHASSIVAALFALAPPAYAAAEEHGAHQAQAVSAAKVLYGRASGVVRKIDPTKATVTIEHGPISGLDMPGMTMSFPVSDKASLAKLKPQQKVQFTVQYDGRNMVITQIR